jgi:hypothetical protein
MPSKWGRSFQIKRPKLGVSPWARTYFENAMLLGRLPYTLSTLRNLCVYLEVHLISMNIPPPKEKGLMPTPLG